MSAHCAPTISPSIALPIHCQKLDEIGYKTSPVTPLVMLRRSHNINVYERAHLLTCFFELMWHVSQGNVWIKNEMGEKLQEKWTRLKKCVTCVCLHVFTSAKTDPKYYVSYAYPNFERPNKHKEEPTRPTQHMVWSIATSSFCQCCGQGCCVWSCRCDRPSSVWLFQRSGPLNAWKLGNFYVSRANWRYQL